MLPDSNFAAGGSIFEPIIIGPSGQPTLVSSSSVAYGVRHRTWGQSGGMRFGMSIRHRPTSGGLAIATRFRQTNLTMNQGACKVGRPAIKCISGCAGDALQEPRTGWDVLPLTGGDVTFELEFDSCVDDFPACVGTRGSLFGRIFEETLEVIEIGSDQQNDFPVGIRAPGRVVAAPC